MLLQKVLRSMDITVMSSKHELLIASTGYVIYYQAIFLEYGSLAGVTMPRLVGHLLSALEIYTIMQFV